MEAVLLVIHLMIALGIIVLVLVQPAESGGFLGSGGSMSNMMAPRRKSDALTRLTGILATSFFATSLLLAIIASHKPVQHDSILDQADTSAPAAVEQPAANDDAPVAGDAGEQPADAVVAPAAPEEDETPKAPIAP